MRVVMKNRFELVHVGINTESPEKALQLAELLSAMEFAGDYFECMKAPFLGSKGHIAMQTDDLAAAVEELREKGFSFRMDTAAYTEEGRLKNIYLDGEFGGFAIHILQK